MESDLRLLMLEDEPADAELTERELRRAGIAFAARRVATRDDFVAALDDFRPDLILADYSLPAFDGLAALGLVRSRAPYLPFIFVTGVMGEEFAIETLHQGAADYVLKGHLSKLAPAVRRALEASTERSARLRAERELAASEEKFRSMAQSAQDGIVVIDQEGLVTCWNPAAQRMFGYGAGEMIGQSLHDRIVPLRFRERWAAAWPHFRATGQGPIVGTTFEIVGRRADGGEFPVELSISAMRLDGQWNATGIIRDISERKATERALHRKNRFLRTLSRCNEVLIHATDEARLLEDMCRTVVEAGGFALAWIAFVDRQDGSKLSSAAQSGSGAEEFLRYLDAERPGTGDPDFPPGRAIRGGRLVLIDDIEAAAPAPWRTQALACGYRASIYLPFPVDERRDGTLNIYSAEVGAFGAEDIALLEELARDLAFGVATLHARVEHEARAVKLERSLEDIVQAMATTIEARDPYTAGHQSRVSRLAGAIAREMGLPEQTVAGVQRGAAIHDLGKIYIPAEILNRPGAMSEIEFSLIKTHPRVGYDIVKDIDFPWPIATMILQHHERLDGSGYPAGLEGEAIIPEARILAVADVVEAMMNHRPYRPALGLDVALDEIAAASGVLFDPDAVAACVRLLRSGAFVM